MTLSLDCWQEFSVPHLVDLSKGLFECPHDMTPGWLPPQQVIQESKAEFLLLLVLEITHRHSTESCWRPAHSERALYKAMTFGGEGSLGATLEAGSHFSTKAFTEVMNVN